MRNQNILLLVGHGLKYNQLIVMKTFFGFSHLFSYELIFSRLIKHTDIDHPDQASLQDALKLVHEILMHLNCKEKEAAENDQREAALRDLEVN